MRIDPSKVCRRRNEPPSRVHSGFLEQTSRGLVLDCLCRACRCVWRKAETVLPCPLRGAQSKLGCGPAQVRCSDENFWKRGAACHRAIPSVFRGLSKVIVVLGCISSHARSRSMRRTILERDCRWVEQRLSSPAQCTFHSGLGTLLLFGSSSEALHLKQRTA